MVVLEQLPEADQILVTDVRGDAELVFELLDRVAVTFVEDLQRDMEVEVAIERLVHRSHAAGAELANDRETLWHGDVRTCSVHHRAGNSTRIRGHTKGHALPVLARSRGRSSTCRGRSE